MPLVFIHCSAQCIHNNMLIWTVNFELLFDDVETVYATLTTVYVSLIIETPIYEYKRTFKCQLSYSIDLRYKYATYILCNIMLTSNSLQYLYGLYNAFPIVFPLCFCLVLNIIQWLQHLLLLLLLLLLCAVLGKPLSRDET